MEKTPKSMKELAKKLGLSRATVSYVLNDKWKQYNISEATVQKVRDYVEATGFTQNIFSLLLKNKLVHDVAILLPDRCLEHQKRAFFILVDWLRRRDMNYIVIPHDQKQYQKTMQQIKLYRVRNIIIIAVSSVMSDVEVWRKMFNNLPECRWLFYDFPFERISAEFFFENNVFCVGIDRLASKRMLFRHIAERGYRKLILQNSFLNSHPLIDFIRKLGMEVSPAMSYVVPQEGTLLEKGEVVGQRIFDLHIVGEDVLAYIDDDLISAGAIFTLLQNDIKIPEELGIVSWDGLPESKYFNLPLTTLVIPHLEMLDITRAWLNAENIANKSILESSIRDGLTM